MSTNSTIFSLILITSWFKQVRSLDENLRITTLACGTKRCSLVVEVVVCVVDDSVY